MKRGRHRLRPMGGATIAGVVVRVLDNRIAVRSGSEELVARRALSCLVEPSIGDSVLVATDADVTWVIAVLDRPRSANATLSVPGELTLHGRVVNIRARDELRLTSQRVSLLGAALDLTATASNFLFEKVRARSLAIECEVGVAKVLASTIETIAERLTEKVESALRVVTGRDQLRAEHIDHAAEKNAVLRGENAIVTAEDLVKMDGKQIHVG